MQPFDFEDRCILFFVALCFAGATYLALSIVTTPTAKPTVNTTVIEYNHVIVPTDSERVQLFIDELLTPKNASCFRSILKRESHMNSKAANSTSTARGLAQILASTYQTLGLRHSDDPLAQIVATLSYISRHYGGPHSTCNAWAFWRTHHFF